MNTPSSLPILALALLVHTGQGYRVTVDLNTYTSTELTFAAQQWPRRINGTWTLANNSGWNGSATLPTDEEWRATLAAVGGQQFSEQMWNCSATDDAAWNCSGISKYGPHSADECTIVRRLAPHGELAGAFCYHETGSKPHTMLSRAEITAASRSCGGCGIIGHTRLYGGPFKAMVDGVLTHPKLLGVAMELSVSTMFGSHKVKKHAGQFVQALLAAGKQPFFLLPFENDGMNTTGLSAADQMRFFLRNVSAQVMNASLLSDPRVNIVVARYGHAGLLPVFGHDRGEDTIAGVVEAALQMNERGSEKR